MFTFSLSKLLLLHRGFGKVPVVAAIVVSAILITALPNKSYGASRYADSPKIETSELDIGELSEPKGLGLAFTNWLKAARAGDQATIFSEASAIYSEMNKLGSENFFILSDAAVALGRSKLASGDVTAAVMIADNAVMMAPDNSDAHFFRATAMFANNKSDVASITGAVVNGVKALALDKLGRDRLLTSAVRYLFLAFLITFLTIFLLMMWINRRAIVADLGAIVTDTNNEFLKNSVAALILIAPLAIGGWLLFLLAIPLFLWPYLKKEGRVVVAIFSLLILVIPYTFEYVAKGVALSGANTYRGLYLLSKNTWDYETKSSLESSLLEKRDEPVILFSLGLINKQMGSLDKSLEFYDKALSQAGENAPFIVRTLVNKGNVFFVSRQYENAMKIYEEAIRIDPESVTALFNLSNTLLELVKTKEGEAAYKQAMSIDSKLTKELMERTRDSHDSRVIDISVANQDLNTYERAITIETSEVSKYLWNVYLAPVTLERYQIYCGAYIVLLLIVAFFWGRKISHKICTTCGISFKPPIVESADTPRCNQCVATQSLAKGGVSSARKDKKRREIIYFAERQSDVASLLDKLIPGRGRSFYGEGVKGLVVTFSSSLFIVLGISAIIRLLNFWEEMSYESLIVNVAVLGSGALYWLLMNSIFKRRFN